MTANATVVNTNEFFCVPVGKSRQAAIFLGNLVKNAIEEGKRIPKRMEMGSDLGTCIKWIEDIGVPVIYAYSAYYSAKCRGMMKGEGQSMRVALEFISKIFGQLSADECMLGWREFCSKGKKIVAALNQLCGEASLLAKNPELLNVTKYCIEGADMLRSITDIWDLASGVAENSRSFTAAFHQDTPVGVVYKEFISDEPTRTSSSRRWRSSEEFLTTAEFERHDRRIAKFRDRSWGKVFTLSVIKAPKVDFYGHGTRADYQKNWDLGLTYQNELRASMKNLAYAMRRDERAHQHNLLRWMICGSTPSEISDACIGAINSLMCVSFIVRRLQPLVGERHATDQSYTVYFRQDKSELNVATKVTLRRDPIAIIYIPSATLARYGAGVAANGTFMVFDVIPFYEVKSIWIGKSNGGKRLEYEDVKRAYSKCVENEICPGFVDSSQESAAMFLQNVAKINERMPETEAGADNLHYIKDMVDRACKVFRENKLEEFDAQTNEIRDEISKVVILNDETWEGLRCRICPSCATAIPTCFCVCLEYGAQLVSTGRFCIHISSDDDGDNQRPNVSGDARRAQDEANHGAAGQEEDDETENVPEEDDMDSQGYTSGYMSEEEDGGWQYRDNDLASRDIINSQRMAICLDEPREAQYMAGFIALQMSKMWGMFEGGEKRTIDAALEGKQGCPYHNDFKKYPNMTEHDQEGILLPSTVLKISQSQNVRERAFRSAEERNEYIRLMVYKCEGLYIFYKLWIAARILDITKDEMKLLVKDRVHPVGDIIYRCFSLAFNCKYISFVREGLNLGRHGYSVNVSAIIAATDPNKCDTPLLDWCLRMGHWIPEDHHKKCVRAREAQKNLDEEFRRRTHRLSIGDRYA